MSSDLINHTVAHLSNLIKHRVADRSRAEIARDSHQGEREFMASKHRPRLRELAAAAGMLAAGGGLWAAPGADDAPPAAGKKSQEAQLGKSYSMLDRAPIPSIVHIDYPEFNLARHIFHADETTFRGWWVPRPLLAFEEPTQKLNDTPTIVWRKKRLPDGRIRAAFRAAISSPEYLKLTADLARRDDGDYLKAQQLRPEQVRVAAWPVTHAVVDCMLDGEVLATGETGSLAGTGNAMEFAINFGEAEWQRFIDAVRDGDVHFRFAYSYQGRQYVHGEVTAQATKIIESAVREALLEHLSPAQRAGKAGIFLAQKNRIERQVRVVAMKTIRATDARVLPMLEGTNAFTGQIFEQNKEITWEEMKADKTLTEQLAKALEPLKRVLRDEVERKKTITREDEKTKTERVKLSFPSFSYGGFEISGGPEMETTTVDRNLVKSECGLTLKLTNDKTAWMPATITTYRLSEGAQKLEHVVRDVVFLGVGTADDYFVETDVPSTFTMAKIGHTVRTDAERYYDGVPLGTVLTYFGAEPPPGYVWFDKTSNWPNDSWVRAELRGKPMPDSNGLIFGGTNDPAKAGELYTDGKLIVPAQEISTGILDIHAPLERLREPFEDHDAFAWIWWSGNGRPFGLDARLPDSNLYLQPKPPVEALPLKNGYKDPTFEPVRLFGLIPRTTTLIGTRRLPEVTVKLNTPTSKPLHLMCRLIMRVK